MRSINAAYPPKYLQLPGTAGRSSNARADFWMSAANYSAVSAIDPNRPDINGVQTSEFLELDFGRVRRVSYLNFDVLSTPLEITISYAASTENGIVTWVPVTPSPDSQFNTTVEYHSSKTNPWTNCSFCFTDANGNTITTRRLRLQFSRKPIYWPAQNTPMFRWSVCVKNLVASRFFTAYEDTSGTYLDALTINDSPIRFDITSTSGSDDTSSLIQRFVFDSSLKRGDYLPDVSGMSFLVYADKNRYKDARFLWTFVNETTGSILDSGTIQPCPQDPVSPDTRQTDAFWVDINLHSPVAVDNSSIFSLAIESLDQEICHEVGFISPNRLSGFVLDGTLSFTGGSTMVTYTSDIANLGLVADDYIQSNSGDSTPVAQVNSITYNAGTQSGTITLTAAYTGSTVSNATATQVYPVELEKQISRTGNNFTTSNGSVTITYSGTDNLTGIFSTGDQVRVAGTADIPITVISVTSTTITLQSPYTSDHTDAALEISRPFVYDKDTSLALRVWGTCGESGQDFLGNSYRTAMVTHKPSGALKAASGEPQGSGWTCAPQPDPAAVEALYLDLRVANANSLPSAVDGINIVGTQGVTVNMYITTESPVNSGSTLTDRDVYDRCLWSPVGTYTLTGANQRIVFPKRLSATFLKLEFTNLKPLREYQIPINPPLPPQEYRTFPTWIQQLFNDPAYQGYRRVVEDWYLETYSQNSAVQSTVQSLLQGPNGSLQAFEYENKLFLMDLNGRTNSLKISRLVQQENAQNVINAISASIIDPVTQSKILFRTTSQFGTLEAQIDQSSLLGEILQSNIDPNISRAVGETDPSFPDSLRTNIVSTTTDRVGVSYSTLANMPLAFDRTCLHTYQIKKAVFNHGYGLTITSVEPFALNTSVTHDHKVIEINPMTANDADSITGLYGEKYNTQTNIPDAILVSGAYVPNAYISYTINGVNYANEAVALVNYAPVALSNSGIAESITVASSADPSATYYQRNNDFVISFSRNTTGDIITSVARSKTAKRLDFSAGAAAANTRDGAIVPLILTPSTS